MSAASRDRRWQMRRWDGEWVDIAGVDDTTIVLASGHGMQWRRQGDSYLPPGHVKLRYSVIVQQQWMQWKPGEMTLLCEDFGHPELADFIRLAQLERRTERTRAAADA